MEKEVGYQGISFYLAPVATLRSGVVYLSSFYLFLKIYFMSYNIAFHYLRNKYGSVFLKYTDNHEKKLKSEKASNEIDLSATDEDKITTFNSPTEREDILLALLMSQCQYGIAARNDLSNLVNAMELKAK